MILAIAYLIKYIAVRYTKNGDNCSFGQDKKYFSAFSPPSIVQAIHVNIWNYTLSAD